MFERFTERARQAIVIAQDEARAMGHNYIGSEHILLGLARVEDGLAAQALAAFDVTPEGVRGQVARIVGRGDEALTGQIPFTPRAKKILELGLREALRLGANAVGTEHLLLALTHDNESVAARILSDFGLDAERTRTEVIRMLSGGRPRGRRAQVSMSDVPPEYEVKALDGASDTWAAQLTAWRREGWELLSVVQEGDAVRAILERRRREASA